MTNKSINLFSPAKINLFFEIINKRIDGFHNIKSRMKTISLYDSIKIELMDNCYEQDFFSSNTTLEWNSSNLIFKAVELFRRLINKKFFVNVTLTKKIPMQAGLGGGSSNAATMLFALNKLFYNYFSLDKLILMASELGCDVPFFFSNGSAICTGKGDLFQEEDCFNKIGCYIAIPQFGMATKSVYNHVDINTCKKKDVLYFNHLESAAFLLNPELKIVKQKLLNLKFSHVVMSGSGSAFVCIGNKNKIINNYDREIELYKVYSISRKKNYWYNQ